MITDAIVGVKTVIAGGLKDSDGDLIFGDEEDILTGYPHPELIQPELPTPKHPVVAVFVRGQAAEGLGHRDLLLREDVVVGDVVHRRDLYSLAALKLSCEVHILAATTDELVGTRTPAWPGYVEQTLVLVRTHPLLLGPGNTEISWDLAGDVLSIPGDVSYAADRRLYLAIVKTELAGRLVPSSAEDGAPIEELYPHDGDFEPSGP
jgi:hypothetical protein